MPLFQVSFLNIIWILGYRKSQSRPEFKRNDSISVIVHDFAVVGPIPASNLSLAKGLAAERAREVLEDPNGSFLLANICDCAGQLAPDPDMPDVSSEDIDGTEGPKLDDETVEGFAHLAKKVVAGLQASSLAPPSLLDDGEELEEGGKGDESAEIDMEEEDLLDGETESDSGSTMEADLKVFS